MPKEFLPLSYLLSLKRIIYQQVAEFVNSDFMLLVGCYSHGFVSFLCWPWFWHINHFIIMDGAELQHVSHIRPFYCKKMTSSCRQFFTFYIPFMFLFATEFSTASLLHALSGQRVLDLWGTGPCVVFNHYFFIGSQCLSTLLKELLRSGSVGCVPT